MSYVTASLVGEEVLVWERRSPTERTLTKHKAPAYCYIDDPQGDRLTIYETPVRRLDFASVRELRDFKRKLEDTNVARTSRGKQPYKLWESDIPAHIKLLADKYYNQEASKLNITFLDIEIDYDPKRGFGGVADPYAPINAIALHHYWSNQTVVLCVPPPGQTWTAKDLLEQAGEIVPIPSDTHITVMVCDSERELMLLFLKEIRESDVLSGWNSDLFDMPYIGKRLVKLFGEKFLSQMTFKFAPAPYFKEEIIYRFAAAVSTDDDDEDDEDDEDEEEAKAITAEKLHMEGRILVDYMRLVKKYEPGERPSYALAPVSDEIIVDDKGNPALPKLEYPGSLYQLYHNNFPYFVRYNIRDCEILKGFEDRLKYVELANTMAHISCGLFDHVLGTIKLAELAIINYAHFERDRIVNDFKKSDIDRSIAGAYVLAPQVGWHRWIGSFDINSLYPSAIRSLNISPETLRGQFRECHEALAHIKLGTNSILTADLEDGTELSMTGDEWRTHCWDHKWAVSGYGTLFDQSSQGIIPSILTEWFATRKKHQAAKKEAHAKAKAILEKYKQH